MELRLGKLALAGVVELGLLAADTEHSTKAQMGDSKQNAYAALGLQAGATRQEVDEAYRSLVKVVHPDVGGDQHMFAELQRAYELLCADEPAAGVRSTPRNTPASAGRHQRQHESSGTQAGIAGAVYWLFRDSLTFWAVLVGVPVICIWALYNNHPEAAIAVGAVTVSAVAAGWWFLRRRGHSN